MFLVRQKPPFSYCSFIWNNSIRVFLLCDSTVIISHVCVSCLFWLLLLDGEWGRERSRTWFFLKTFFNILAMWSLLSPTTTTTTTFSAHFPFSSNQELGSQQEAESAGMYHYILKMAYLLLLPAGSCFCPSKCSGVWKRQLHLTGWPFNSHDYLLSIHNYYRWWFPRITISYSRL